MDSATFDLLNLVAPKITFSVTHLRKLIPPGERLALTLRFMPLVQCNEFVKIMMLYLIMFIL